MANAFSGERKRGHVKWVSSRENILTACMHYPPRATPTTFARTGLGTHLAQLGMERGTSSTPRATSWPGDTHCPLGAAELQLHPPRCAFWGWEMLHVLWGQGVMAQSCPCTWQLAAAGIFLHSICDFLPTQCPSSDARNDKLLQTRSNSDPSRFLPQSSTPEEAPHHPARQESTFPHP